MHGVKLYKFEYKLGTETDYKLEKEITSSKNSCSYTYIDLTQEIVNNLKVIAIDSLGNTREATLDITPDTPSPMNPDTDGTYAGTVVDYTPKAGQVYNVEAKYSGYSSDQSWTTSDYKGTWSVWGTDDNYIYIISTNVTTKNLYLQGMLGYNNGVTLLDTLCDTTFTDKTTYPRSVAQNLKLEQVLAVKDSSIATSNSNYGKAPYSYTNTYPYIWNTYEKNANDSINNRSKAYALTTQTSTDSQFYSPYLTAWYNDRMNTLSAWVNSNYYSMIMNPAQSRHYWLSSRYVAAWDSSGFGFSLHNVISSGVNTPGYLCSGSYSGGMANLCVDRAIRPIISFPKSIYSLDTSTTPAKIVKRTN